MSRPVYFQSEMIAAASLALLAVLGCSSSTLHPDLKGCCPPDPVMSSCMALGGYSPQGCGRTCDFFCSTNWRIEDDSHGCPTWRYDTRSPGPGENLACLPTPGSGSDAADSGPD